LLPTNTFKALPLASFTYEYHYIAYLVPCWLHSGNSTGWLPKRISKKYRHPDTQI
jgi:hypothetical protein